MNDSEESLAAGLKPTYEEWKLAPASLNFDKSILSLKPTYEEWKRLLKCMSFKYVHGLKPTYEEWKLIIPLLKVLA